jgi:poly-gamma-glutamate synthesis protein (capsule biosynthesis protein)
MAGLNPDASARFPVLPFTTRGRRTVWLLRLFYRLLAVFWRKKWETPLPGFEENPRESPYLGATYLGYKYYFRPPVNAEPGIEAHFRGQTLCFEAPANFWVHHRLTMTVGGDLMPYERLRPETTRHLWDEVGPFFFGADVVVGNLETPLVTSLPPGTVPEVMLNDMHFNGSEALFRIFNGNDRFRGFDVLGTANNHSLDQGERGVVETLDYLEKRGILAPGTARTPAERERVTMLQRNGIRVAFVAYTYSLNKFLPPLDKPWLVNYDRLNVPGAPIDALVADVTRARRAGADVVALLLHTGNAYQAFPSAHTVAVYHRLFEQSGVDLILGSHPHNPQPMERYAFRDPITGREKQGFAIYSLGDFVAYDIFVWGRLVPLLKLTLEKGILNGQPHAQLTDVNVLPVYHWGDKTGDEVRFLDLQKTLRLVENGKRPPFLSDLCERELRHLAWFNERYFLPENGDYLLASTD